jgi:hypothetical protein
VGAWGTAVFSDDLAADVRGNWRELLLDGHDTDAAAEQMMRSYQHAIADEDDVTVFWLAFAAAQIETGRLQDSVKEKALAIIAAGGDVGRWAEEDPTLARQREQVLDRLATKLRGRQAQPKRLRRQKSLGVAFDVGDVVLVRSRSGERRALAVVVAQDEGYPRGTVNPVVELLAWEGGDIPTRSQMETLPAVMHLNDLRPGHEPYLRPHLWVILTATKRDMFSSEHGEVVERGLQREPSGDHRRTDVFSEVGASSCAWPSLCLYLDQEYADELRLTLGTSRPRRRPRLLRRR